MIVAETATSVAPWWGVPLIAGVFTVIGVAAAQGVAWLLDQRKARREDERRWLTDRRQAYATFLTAATRFHMRLRQEWDIASPDATPDLLAEANFSRQEVRLIASDAVGTAADDLFRHLAAMRRALDTTTLPDRDREQWRALARTFQDKREAFIARSRSEWA